MLGQILLGSRLTRCSSG